MRFIVVVVVINVEFRDLGREVGFVGAKRGGCCLIVVCNLGVSSVFLSRVEIKSTWFLNLKNLFFGFCR